MATTELPTDIQTVTKLAAQDAKAGAAVSVRDLLLPLASLRLTVWLFAISMVLVLAGTLAQIDYDIWYVIKSYFRCWIAFIELKVFFPRDWTVPGVVPFPGGWFVGVALGVNLLAAHGLRFKVTGHGGKLWAGWAMIALGSLLTYVVVQSGLDDAIESELSPAFASGLWHALRAALAGGTLVFAYLLALSYSHQRRQGSFWLWILGAVVCVKLMVLVGWLFMNPDVRLDPSGLRILWQLIKAGATGLVLLAGCYLVFGRRAGIVLLHGGIALLMFSELFTGLKAVEAQMWLVEGQQSNYAEDSREVELVVVDKSSANSDVETLIPQSFISEAAQGEPIDHPALPVRLRVVDFLPNSSIRLLQPGEETPTTRGEGLLYAVEGASITTGVDENQTIENPAAYVELLDKDSGNSLGTILLWAQYSPGYIVEPLKIDGKHYEFGLRYKRIPKDYAIELIDFQHDTFVGTSEAKNFSSELRLTDPELQVEFERTIWMNNPLRYSGDTIYQASFDPSNPRRTALQIVTNSGWMMPYVSCMLILTGLLAHFGTTFYRFAQRMASGTSYSRSTTLGELLANWNTAAVLVPTLLVLIIGGWTLSKLRTPRTPSTEFQMRQFGELPVAYQGRIQPLDTLARNALTILSGKESLVVPGEKSALAEVFRIEKKEPAIRWLLDLASDSKTFRTHRCIRIENLDVLQILGLERRKGFLYSLADLFENYEEYTKQIQLAAEVKAEERSLTQAMFIKLANNVSLLTVLHDSFSSPLRFVRTTSHDDARTDLATLFQRVQTLNQQAPLAVPPEKPGEKWQMLLAAESTPLFELIAGKKQEDSLDPAAEKLRTILSAYRAGEVLEFNNAVIDYKKIVDQRAAADAEFDQQTIAASGPGSRKTAEKLNVSRLEFESSFNHFRPFAIAMAFYVLAFLLAICSWLGGTTTLNRSANWLLWFTFLLHTAALLGRLYISGRPPVTNLYSSAVFIGWAAVLFALIFEWIYRIGVGNLLAAVVGFPTLFIAHNLAGDGDTFKVLQAVLDTQFWLATHVVCITLGYAATFVAGILGLFYVIGLLVDRDSGGDLRQVLTRMTYGTICFATLFSFIGTILGGLWADDSWGRFWGWDPKENGALLIVIWNALVLHARWGGMIQRRGLAVLAIFGNVVTAWSWFGVNEMGVGLHAYGFREGMRFWLTVFVLSQLLMIALGAVMRDGDRASDKPTAAT